MQQNVNKEHSLDCPARLEGTFMTKTEFKDNQNGLGRAPTITRLSCMDKTFHTSASNRKSFGELYQVFEVTLLC